MPLNEADIEKIKGLLGNMRSEISDDTRNIMQTELTELKQEVSRLGKENKVLKEKLFEMEVHSRKNIMMFYKIPEAAVGESPKSLFSRSNKNSESPKNTEKTAEVLVKHLHDYFGHLGDYEKLTIYGQLSMVFRVGKKVPNKSRPIKAIFHTPYFPEKIRFDARRIKDKKSRSFGFGPDKPKLQREIEFEHRDQIQEARNAKKKVQWKTGKLLVEGKEVASVADRDWHEERNEDLNEEALASAVASGSVNSQRRFHR